MNFTKLFSLLAFIALAVLSLGFASAAVTVTTTSSATPSVVQGGQVNFAITATASGHSGNFTNAMFVLPVLFSGASWSGNSTFNLLNETLGSPVTQTITLTVPSTVAPGTYNGAINFTGSYLTPSGSTVPPQINALPITITVPAPAPSANLTITAPTSAVNVGQNATLTITNTGNSTLTNIIISEITANPFLVTFMPSTINLAQGANQAVQAITTGLSNIKFGFNTVNVKAAAGAQNATASFQIKKTFCSSGPVVGNLSIGNVDWSNEGEGSDNDWELLDEIELEVEVKNSNDDDEIDAIVKLGLFDLNGQNNADDLIYLENSDGDKEEVPITVNENDEETVTYRFKVPADLDEGSYKLALKVYDEDEGESKDCDDSTTDFNNDFFQEIEVKQTSDEDRYVIVDEITADSPVSCGEIVNGEFTVFNVGKKNQDRVKITMKNNALNLDQEFEITEDLDKGKDKTIDYQFQIPQGVENKFYTLAFRTQYDYKNGVYRQESDKEFIFPVEVAGCTGNLGNAGNTSLTSTQISAELDSEAVAGEQLVVKATITNTGTESKSYSISARNYNDWAELDDISDESFSIGAGEDKEIILTFTVNSDATGTKTFDIQAASGGKVMVQEVEVEIGEAKKKFSFNFGDNSAIWIIGIVNVVLILLIIVVAVRLSKR